VAKTAMDRPVQVSILDRLTDSPLRPSDLAARGEPVAARPAWHTAIAREESMDALRDSVRRDLEWLLNTRRTPAPVPGELAELTRSVFRYGLRDMTTLNSDSAQQREELRRDVEEAIAVFEPRLANVRVNVAMGPSGTEAAREVRFVIEALLRVDPAPERIVFDTVLETTGGGYHVREAGGA
jgi:type VI secretion system protein ImpF